MLGNKLNRYARGDKIGKRGMEQLPTVMFSRTVGNNIVPCRVFQQQAQVSEYCQTKTQITSFHVMTNVIFHCGVFCNFSAIIQVLTLTYLLTDLGVYARRVKQNT